MIATNSQFSVSASIIEDGEEVLRLSLDRSGIVIDAGPGGKVVLDPDQWGAVINEWSRYTALRAAA